MHRKWSLLTSPLLRTRRQFSSINNLSDVPFKLPYRSKRPRRGLLYIPGSSPKMLAKAGTLGADSVCLDLEDAVSDNKKAEARENIKTALQTHTFGNSERLVRINPIGSGLEDDDLKAILSLPTQFLPDAFVIPKVNDEADLAYVNQAIQHTVGPLGDHIKLIALIETGDAVMNLENIVLPHCPAFSGRLEALIFGADDYAADVGAVRTQSNQEVWFARNLVVIQAARHQLQAIDIVQIDFKNETQLLKECNEAFHLGYTGKQIIHPSQIIPTQKAFSPTSEQIKWASRVMDGYAENREKGLGAFSLDNKMIDMPTIKAAYKILERAKSCGLTVTIHLDKNTTE